jgi:hypothetical protein
LLQAITTYKSKMIFIIDKPNKNPIVEFKHQQSGFIVFLIQFINLLQRKYVFDNLLYEDYLACY